MNELWLTIKGWAKAILFSIVLIYAILFVFKNSGKPVDFWWWFDHEKATSVFFLTSGAFVAGMLFTIILTTSFKTMRQIRDLRSRSRQEKLERNLNEMAAKAALLQTRPAATEDRASKIVDRK
jgi:lysylphosphatidylglycerol synthetase-like protein (DUF2156 family)